MVLIAKPTGYSSCNCAENHFMNMPMKAEDGCIEYTIFVDGCSVEIFSRGETMSALAFTLGESYGVSVSAVGKADIELTCWEIG